MLRFTFCTLFLSFAFALFSANGGYEIKVKLENFTEKEAYLATYYGDKPYIQDSIAVNDQGLIIFKGDEALDAGVYLIVLPPDNQFLQIFIDADNQHFTVEGDFKKLAQNEVQIKGSPTNALFYEYVQMLNDNSPKAQKIRDEITAMKEAGKNTDKKVDELNQLNIDVRNFQDQIIEKAPKSILATWIKFGFEPDIPEFDEKDETELQRKRYYYRKAHFFDRIDMADPSLYHNPMLFKKIDYYMNQLTPPMADSIVNSLDHVLGLIKPAQKTFEFYLRHFLNKYAADASKVVGMDKVYVHIVEQYYARGLAPWLEEDQLTKIRTEAARMKPTLIGRQAPNIKMTKEDGSKIELHDLDAEYTVMFFWRPGCSHCKKATPFVLDFLEKNKDKGVKVFATCIKLGEDADECWKFVKEKEMEPLINTFDPTNSSKFYTKYDTRITPRIYILDKNKKILINRIGAEQLQEVLDQIIEQEGK